MVQANAYGGDRKLNPLKFHHYDISRAAFYIDNESITKCPYRLNPAQDKYIEPFLELYSILGKAGKDKDIDISLKDYEDGLFLIPFDVTPTSSTNMEYMAKKRGWQLQIGITFQKTSSTQCDHHYLCNISI